VQQSLQIIYLYIANKQSTKGALSYTVCHLGFSGRGQQIHPATTVIYYKVGPKCAAGSYKMESRVFNCISGFHSLAPTMSLTAGYLRVRKELQGRLTILLQIFSMRLSPRAPKNCQLSWTVRQAGITLIHFRVTSNIRISLLLGDLNMGETLYVRVTLYIRVAHNSHFRATYTSR
jgi:hypothetical protein